MTVANLRYGHLENPWNSPLSFGIQAFVEFNGLVLNDRYQTDKYRITSITGLDSSQIRDSREPIPGSHNEFAYDAYYEGRNIVLNGKIECGSIQVYNWMKSNLLAAFAELVESPLKFKWFDINDNFDDPATIYPYSPIANVVSGNYEALIGSMADFSVESGFLLWTKAANAYLVRVAEKRVFSDVQQTIIVIPGSINTESSFGFLFGIKNNENYCSAMYFQNNGEPYLAVQVTNENVTKTVGEVKIPSQYRPTVGTPFFLRGRKVGNELVAEFWLSEPKEYNLPIVSISDNLEGPNAQNFGEKVLAQVGLGGNQKDVLWRFDQYKIESIYPGDVAFNARCVTAPQIKEEQTTLNKISRDFQIVLKSSDFRAFSSTQTRKTIVPTSVAGNTLRGLSYPIEYPISYRKILQSSVYLRNNILSIKNSGSVFVEPIIVAYGPFESLSIINLTNGLEMFYSGLTEKNEYILFDCTKRKRVYNSATQNMMEHLSTSSSAWIVIEPGWNDLYITGTGLTSESVVAVYLNNGFLG